jgi:ATP-dependent Zn protease
LTRLTQVDNIAALIKVDEVEEYYTQKSEIYKQQRMWLVFAVIITLLVILIVTIFYRKLQQKKHYENLLFAAKKQELAFINSHDVRKHLANILGLQELIRNSENTVEEYLLIEHYLFDSIRNLDEVIKSVSEKLEE